MKTKDRSLKYRSIRFPHTVKTEILKGTTIQLTNFFFRYGANIYVFSYEKNGHKKHTFIDTGYATHRNVIFPILEENNIDLRDIENILITHRHPDHSGLAADLSETSGATIMAHENFKDFVEGKISEGERRWLGKFDPTRMKKCRVEYLFAGNADKFIPIGGIDFPVSNQVIDMGGEGTLSVITIPESELTHSPDQIAILYSPRKSPYVNENKPEKNGFRPTDEMIFAGDLWLMRGPIFEKSLRSLPLTLKFFYFKIKDLLSGEKEKYPLPSEQDAKAKDALKQGFSLIRVKPGHGDEFLGSNMIPKTLLANRDLLIKLGYQINDDKSLLSSKAMAEKVKDLREKAYADFVKTLNLWLDMGYSLDDISDLLVHIYREQTGGGPLVEEDRKERKKRLRQALSKLASEKAPSDSLFYVAKKTLSVVNNLR